MRGGKWEIGCPDGSFLRTGGPDKSGNFPSILERLEYDSHLRGTLDGCASFGQGKKRRSLEPRVDYLYAIPLERSNASELEDYASLRDRAKSDSSSSYPSTSE